MKSLSEGLVKFFAILKSAGWQGLLLTLLIIGLIRLYWDRYNPEDNFDNSFWELIDPVSAISTFIITLFLLYNQSRQRWEDKLEKLLDVDYVYADGSEKGVEIAKVKEAYLAGETDVRAWAQALGSQMMGNLDFDMNWDDPRPEIIRSSSGKFCKYYYIKMYLTDHPFRDIHESDSDSKKKQLSEAKSRIHDFLKRSFQYSCVTGDIDHLPISWARKA